MSVVPSPYEGTKLRVRDHLALSAFWFGTNVMWTALLLILIPKHMEMMKGREASAYNGNLIGIGAIIALIIPLIIGPLSDRCQQVWGRRRPFIAVGAVVNLVGLGIIYSGLIANSFPQYLAGYLAVQLGNNIATGAYTGLIPDLVPEDQRGIASGYMGLLTQLGSALGAIGCIVLVKTKDDLGVLLPNPDFSLAFIFIGAVVTLSAAFTLFGIKENRLQIDPPRFNWNTYIRSLWIDPKKYPDFAWVWITRALVMLGFYTVQPNIQYYLRDVVNLPDPARDAGYLFLAVLLAATVTGLLGGWLSDRTGRKKIVYIANTLMTVTALAFPFCRSFETATLVAVIFGLGYGAYISVDWALGTDVLPNKQDAGKDMAVWHIAMVLPQSLAAPLAGFILLALGTTQVNGVAHYSQTGYMAIFGMAALFLALGAFWLRNVKGAR